MVYRLLKSLFPVYPPAAAPRRIVLVQPCCIGDVVLATAALAALRRGYPQAHLTWAVGGWSKAAVAGHPLLDAVLDSGRAALPVRLPGGFLRFVRQMRAGRFDLAVSLVRSPLMGLALWAAGIPHRAGPDSGGRGFAYSVRAPVDPSVPRHEAEVYLDVVRALGVDTSGCRANLPLRADPAQVATRHGLTPPYVVVHPGGGSNPGMTLDLKRYPPERMAALADGLAERLGAQVALVGAANDAPLLDAVARHMTHAPVRVGTLTFAELGALARGARLYAGNDTGMTHLAAASGAKTVMILGPSDPARYAPYTDDALVLWKPSAVMRAGVAGGAPPGWSWQQDGIGVDEALARIAAWLGENS